MFKKIKKLVFLKRTIEEKKKILYILTSCVSKLTEQLNDLENDLSNKEKLFNNIASVADELSESKSMNSLYFNSVSHPLNFMKIEDLKDAFTKNTRKIEETLQKYKTILSDKQHSSIYKLLVIALNSELQNVLHKLDYSDLDDSMFELKKAIYRILNAATSNNQSIASILVNFIGELTPLFMNAIKIEHEYYVRKVDTDAPLELELKSTSSSDDNDFIKLLSLK